MNTQSKLYKEMTREEIRRVLRHNLGRAEMEPPQLMEGGLFNTTYRITLKNPARTLVLRAGPVNTHLLLPFEHHLMHAEQAMYRLHQEHGIPCPHVVAWDTSRTLIHRDYMLVDFIDGVALSDLSIPERERGRLYRQAGFYTARMHRITGQSFGRADDVLSGKGCATWISYLEKELGELEQASLQYGVFTAKQFSGIRDVFHKRSALFEGVTRPYLVHADLWDGNVLVSKGPDGYRVAAVIDADRSLFGDPDFDLACPWAASEEFFEGLGEATPPKDGLRREKMDAYRMLVAAMDAYVWAVEYNNTVNSENSKQTALKISRGLLKVPEK